MKKSAAAQLLAKLPGFRRIGSFHIGTCNEDVISGYALDAPSGGLYIWRFILPTYDRIEFLHLSLGKRIANLPPGDAAGGAVDRTEIEILLRRDWQDFSAVHDTNTLLAYMEREQCAGDYPQWTKYLTHIRAGHFESAGRLEEEWRNTVRVPRVRSIVESMKTIVEMKDRSGWLGVQELLTEWSKRSASKFCH